MIRGCWLAALTLSHWQSSVPMQCLCALNRSSKRQRHFLCGTGGGAVAAREINFIIIIIISNQHCTPSVDLLTEYSDTDRECNNQIKEKKMYSKMCWNWTKKTKKRLCFGFVLIWPTVNKGGQWNTRFITTNFTEIQQDDICNYLLFITAYFILHFIEF